jgi:hypothetical protein
VQSNLFDNAGTDDFFIHSTGIVYDHGRGNCRFSIANNDVYVDGASEHTGFCAVWKYANARSSAEHIQHAGERRQFVYDPLAKRDAERERPDCRRAAE